MSLIDLHLGEVPDLHTVEPSEYQLQVISAESKVSIKGNPMIAVMFDILGSDNAQSVFHTLMLPKPEDDEKAANSKKRRIKAFFEAFDVHLDGSVELDDLTGSTGWAILKEEDDEEFGARNTISRFVTPQ